MKALFDFRPNFCPNCGKEITWKGPYAAQDFFAHASHACLTCKLLYQLAETENINGAATKSGGDLEQY
jgi:hypothetical protein